MERFAKKKRIKRTLLAIAIGLLAIVFVYLVVSNNKRKPIEYDQFVVSTGNIEQAVNGDGIISLGSGNDYYVPAGIKIEDVKVKEGQHLHKGEIIATLNPQYVEIQIAKLNERINEIDDILYEERGHDIEEIKAPIKARIVKTYCNDGAYVNEIMNKYGYLMLLSTDGFMKVCIKSDADIAHNTDVTITTDDNKIIKGTIKRKSDDIYTVIYDDRYGHYGSIMNVYYENTYIGSGIADVNLPFFVVTDYEGIIREVLHQENETIEAHQPIIKLESGVKNSKYKKALIDYQLANEKMMVLQQMKNSLAVHAPSNCTVVAFNVKDGMIVGDSSNNTEVESQYAVLCTMSYDEDAFVLIQISERDISKIAINQTAEIMFESGAANGFSGYINCISQKGKEKNGIVTYDVMITADECDKNMLFDNMKVTARIKYDDIEALVIPQEYIIEEADETFVLTKKDDTMIRKKVICGKCDGEVVQITSGIIDGDVIYKEKEDAQDDTIIDYAISAFKK